MTTRYLDAVTKLHSNGYPHLATAAIEHYERLASGMTAEHRCRVSAMFDEVLETALNEPRDLTPEDVLLSPDFAAIQGLALILRKLKLVDEVEVDIELTDLDVIQGEFVEAIKPQPIQLFDSDIVEAELDDEPLTNIMPSPRRLPPILLPTPGKTPSRRLF